MLSDKSYELKLSIQPQSNPSDSMAKKVSLLFFALLLACSGTFAGQEKTETQKQTNDRIEQLADIARTHPVDTPIGTGDLLHIDVFDIPELSRDLRVSDVGDISFPLVPGRIPAAGLTPFQLEEKLEQLLIDNGLVTHPQVSVFVREQNSQPVSVVGAVNKPMVYQVIRPTSLLEVLADAGGISDDAGSVVLITRPARPGAEKTDGSADATPSSPDSQTITIRLQDLLDSGDPSYNIQVFGGDAVSVPRAGIIYVTGAGVVQPGGYVLQSHGEQVTTMKAVALAHGLTSYAKADDAVILRTNPLTGQKDQIPVHLRQIQNRKAEDIPMKSNDILYIPDSVGLKVLAKGAEAAVSVTSGVIVYRSGTR